MPRHGIVEQPPKHHLLLPRREELKVPTRKWLAATRTKIALGEPARFTRSPVRITASARVGMPNACMASPMRYSRSAGPSAALPSPRRENGVRPDP